jgi:hypothetical protein
MTWSPPRLAALLWLGLVVLIAGRLLDLRWHATHDEFETASDQLRAHWLAWLGALILLAAAVVVFRRQRGRGLSALLIGAAGYGVVAGWHLYEHSQDRDPDLPHVLLALTQLTMLVAAPLAAMTVRRR